MNQLEEKQAELLIQMKKDISVFLAEHPDLVFYCFAFDCNSDYAQILLCFNTECDFQKTLKEYQSGEYKKYYQKESDIFSLRYNTGDWQYQGISDYTVMEEDELESIYGDDYDLMCSEMMEFNYGLLKKLCQTDEFKSIPKTADFKVLCIDHDQDPEEAVQNTETYVGWTHKVSWS